MNMEAAKLSRIPSATCTSGWSQGLRKLLKEKLLIAGACNLATGRDTKPLPLAFHQNF
jgi:hypothetical protein